MSSISSGTTSTTTLVHSGDTTGSLVFKTNDTGSGGTTAMTIDTSQNVGIGTSSPSFDDGTGVQLSRTGTATYRATNTSNSVSLEMKATNALVAVSSRGNYPLIMETNGTERMRIDSSGNLLVNSTSNNGGGKVYISSGVNGLPASSGTSQPNAALRLRGGDNAVLDFGLNSTTTWMQATDQSGLSNFYNIAINPNGGSLLVGGTTNTNSSKISVITGGSNLNGIEVHTAGNNNAMTFYSNSSTYAGAISLSGSTTSYTSASDYRLKHDIAPMTGALSKVSALKPVTYKWNADNSNGEGFIAHELKEIFPDAVVGEKDAVNEDGSIKPQGIDTSFLVATLTAAIQEQQATITALTARIEALENK